MFIKLSIFMVLAALAAHCGRTHSPIAAPEPGGEADAQEGDEDYDTSVSLDPPSGFGVDEVPESTDPSVKSSAGTPPPSTTSNSGNAAGAPASNTAGGDIFGKIGDYIKQFAGGSSMGGGSLTDAPGCVEGDAFACEAEAALVKYTNEIRAQAGKSPLTHHFRLSYVARDWSRQQGKMISHAGFPGARATVYQQKFPGEGVPSMGGENVAMNMKSGDADATGKSFANQWKNSPGHYTNMIGSYRAIGVGISCSGGGSSGGSIFSQILNMGGGCTATQIFIR